MNEDHRSEDISTADEPFLILLVEDNNAHTMLIMRTFERLGFSGKIDWVKDGRTALDYTSSSTRSWGMESCQNW